MIHPALCWKTKMVQFQHLCNLRFWSDPFTPEVIYMVEKNVASLQVRRNNMLTSVKRWKTKGANVKHLGLDIRHVSTTQRGGEDLCHPSHDSCTGWAWKCSRVGGSGTVARQVGSRMQGQDLGLVPSPFLGQAPKFWTVWICATNFVPPRIREKSFPCHRLAKPVA